MYLKAVGFFKSCTTFLFTKHTLHIHVILTKRTESFFCYFTNVENRNRTVTINSFVFPWLVSDCKSCGFNFNVWCNHFVDNFLDLNIMRIYLQCGLWTSVRYAWKIHLLPCNYWCCVCQFEYHGLYCNETN